MNGVLESGPEQVGPSGPPQVGPELDLSTLSLEEIERQIAELDRLAGGDGADVAVDAPVSPTVGPTPSTPSDGFTNALKSVENSVKAGWDETAGKWNPHESLEGGTKTLGYGHKLTDREAKNNSIVIDGVRTSLEGGISDEQIDRLFKQDVVTAERSLKKSVPEFANLEQKYKDILINISFNVGKVTPKGWPKLLKAMKAGDDEKVREEMVTSYKDEEGNRIQLSERAATIADAVLM